jgi:hypothetical protein
MRFEESSDDEYAAVIAAVLMLFDEEPGTGGLVRVHWRESWPSPSPWRWQCVPVGSGA